MPRYIAIKLPDDVYRKLEERARNQGFTLVSDYIRNLILRELEKPSISMHDIESRLSRLEEGELTPQLYQRIWEIASRALKEKIGEVEAEGGRISIEKMFNKLERRIQDLINPWTAKIDQLASKIADLYERIEALEQRLNEVTNEVKELTKRTHYHAVEQRIVKRRSAIERLKEQGVVFESEVKWLRDRDLFFDRLRREGAVIIDVGGERVAIDKRFWENFIDKIEKLPTSNEEEIKILLTEPQFKLFKKLREAGLIYFDSTKKCWKLTEKIGEKA